MKLESNLSKYAKYSTILWIITMGIFAISLYYSSRTYGAGQLVPNLFVKLLLFDVFAGIIFFCSSLYYFLLKFISVRVNFFKKMLPVLVLLPGLGLAIAVGITAMIDMGESTIASNTNYTTNLTGHESPNGMKEHIYSELNKERANAGLNVLTINKNLEVSALAKANDIISKGYWSHESPDGQTPWELFGIVGYSYTFAGENLARDFFTGTSAHRSWMNSEGHRENILSNKYSEVGVAVLDGKMNGVNTRITVQHFGTPYGEYTEATANQLVNYYEWCTGKNIQVKQSDIVVKPSGDGNTYGMINSDWICYEGYLKNEIVPDREVSRTGRIIDYNEFCTGEQISVYENELIYQKANDGKIYAMTQADWDCYYNN